MRLRRLAALALSASVLALLPALAGAQAAKAAPPKKPLDLEVLYSSDPAKRVDFGSPMRTSYRWVDDRHYAASGGKSAGVKKVEARTGKEVMRFDTTAMESAFTALPGIAPEDARTLGRGAVWSEDGKTMLVVFADDLYLWRVGERSARRLTADPAVEQEYDFSPDGRMVSYVSGNDLWVADAAGGAPRRLTTGGGPKLLHGVLDWVYQEEVFGRGDWRAYWWSPDSRRIAFLRLDESAVPEFTVVDHLALHQDLEVGPYPKPGDPNPVAAVGVVAAAGGEVAWVDLGRYVTEEPLVVRVGWTPKGDKIVLQVQDREQTWLDLGLADPDGGKLSRLLRESGPAWTERGDEAYFLADGTFVWTSTRSGFKHLYLMSAGGEVVRALTAGEWEVEDVYGVDEKNGRVFFQADRDEAIGRHVYRVDLAGGEPVRLTTRPGSHRPEFSPDFRLFLDGWSDAATPTQTRLHGAADGAEIRVVDDGAVPALAEYDLGTVEFLQVPARDGFAMEAMAIKASDFDATARHPVLIYQYSGPQAPVVRNAWMGPYALFHRYLASRGIVVFSCDNRSASGRGWKYNWPTHRRLGVLELADLEDCVTWLKAQSWVDGERIGVWGWSFGGYMTAYALTHSTSFKMGIAGAPVIDWKLYDSIYTERLMGRPQTNPDGYLETSALEAAADLHGSLLLLHGTTDDNVHLQNTLSFARALQKAGKPFEMMLYPKMRHGPMEREQSDHLMKTMIAFIERSL